MNWCKSGVPSNQCFEREELLRFGMSLRNKLIHVLSLMQWRISAMTKKISHGQRKKHGLAPQGFVTTLVIRLEMSPLWNPKYSTVWMNCLGRVVMDNTFFWQLLDLWYCISSVIFIWEMTMDWNVVSEIVLNNHLCNHPCPRTGSYHRTVGWIGLNQRKRCWIIHHLHGCGNPRKSTVGMVVAIHGSSTIVGGNPRTSLFRKILIFVCESLCFTFQLVSTKIYCFKLIFSLSSWVFGLWVDIMLWFTCCDITCRDNTSHDITPWFTCHDMQQSLSTNAWSRWKRFVSWFCCMYV